MIQKKYFINISRWNLLESFIAESLSPHSFYEQRNFGNGLGRNADGDSEQMNVLVLSTKDLGGDYSVIVDESLIDKNGLNRIGKSKTLYTYDRTVYYRKGLVEFMFSSEEPKNSLIAESKMLFGVKCIEKYSSDFVVRKTSLEKAREYIKKHPHEYMPFEEKNQIEFDNLYDRYKGAAIGFMRGSLTSIDEKENELQAKTKDMKKAFAGLNTNVMMGAVPITDAQSFSGMINDCRKLFHLNRSGKTNLFDILEQHFKEAVKISEDKAAYMEQHQRQYLKDKAELEKLEAELAKLKKKKKNEDSAEIPKIEEERNEKEKLIKSTSSYEAELARYNGALASLFVRISDICNDIIKKILDTFTEPNVDMSALLRIDNDGRLVCNGSTETEKVEEKVYFECTLNHILKNMTACPISDDLIMNVITGSENSFKKHYASNTDRGKTILECIGTFYKYKKQESKSFLIPDGYPILQSMMSFFVKPYGFDQIERYMLNRGYQYKSYAFALWGACLGFCSIPKTFTSVLYKNDERIGLVDDYLESIKNGLKEHCLQAAQGTR